jgi:hypothetical protein
MARTTPRPPPTATRTLQPLGRHCPLCGETMWAAYHNYRTITTLDDVLHLTLQIRRCLNRACPHFRRPYRPEAEGRLALPKHEFGRLGKIKPLFTPSHPPACAHPLPPCARWCPRLGAPTPAAGPPWREPAGHRPAPQGPARTAAGQPARLGRRGGACGAGTAVATAGAHPPCRPRATARGRPQRTRAQWRPPGAASAGRQTAAAGPARLG